MDFSLSNEQRAWQMTARKFAEEEIKPITLKLDEAPDAHGTFDWDIVEKGSKLGFRTMAVAKEYGGEGTDYVTQALVMAELARGDSAISKTFSQNWKWSHLIQQACNDEQKERFLRPFVADHRFLLGKGITEPTAGSDNRCRRRTRPRPASSCAPSARATNGSSTARNASSPTRRSASCSSSTRAPIPTRRCARAPPCSWCPTTRRASGSARCSTRAAGGSIATAR